jgi:hypothetical protein
MFPRFSQRLGALLLSSLVAMSVAVFPAAAWGPHPRITEAALEVLGTNHPLARALGPQFLRLTNTCWMADFKRLPFREPDQDFYADDYLLFPQAPAHLDHICPEVKKTYEPYFRRALQALRTESPANAARWIGSLLHFVEDTGSPPHAAEIRGDIHIKMENWVKGELIHIEGYRPRRLGTNDATALAGFQRRMDQLIEFSKPRGLGLRTRVVIGQRLAVEPVVLECALETSRVVVDLLHTLGQLTFTPSAGSCVLRGRIESKAAPMLEKVPARLMLSGTNIATLAETDGTFELRGVPAGEHRLIIGRPGSSTTNLAVVLTAGRTNFLSVILPAMPANLLRNGDFSVKWIQTNSPDCWTRLGNTWEGEVIALKPEQRYRLAVNFKPGATGDVLVRWTRQLPHAPQNIKLPKIDSRPLTPEQPTLDFTGSDTMALLQVMVRTKNSPESICRSITLVAMDTPEK